MTYEQAREKAERLTRAGTPTRVKRAAIRPGGWQTYAVAADERYDASEKGKARNRRVKLGRNNTSGTRQIRLNDDGLRFREADLLELRQRQGDKCFVLRIPIDGTTRNGAKIEHVDHDHRTGFVRAPVHRDVNVIAGLLEKHGITTYDNLVGFATRMAALFMMPWLAMTEDEIRRAKARARRRRAA
jgi:hypothetical protein